MHGSPYMCRPRPFPRAHKREASGGLFGTNYSPKSVLEKMRERARVNRYLLAGTEPCKRVFSDPVIRAFTEGAAAVRCECW